ncbi:hypothetical protein PUN71_012545 [Arthrobacter sp. NQ7]|uniref:alcohol dehydrogenase catalytic domain-containing protein n=1 Tax=Arthrobacter sp. NQ7 TaxID=3032303 RepID=UPI00240EC925|nr:hypothetical protein [Arthrobacter sp. NQ7]MDJ0458035.1 hypothetical protein [Arthrobacter sp. NQ7]
MTNLTYRAYQVTAPRQEAELVSLTEASLPEGDLTVRVTHSSLNYKDGLAMTGKPGVVRAFPLTCGIDLAGRVIEAGGGFANGDEVVLTGANLSETRPGGYSGYQRIEAGSVVKAPTGLGTWGTMAVGTAGLTAMLCILRLRTAGIEPGSGPVLVTGATGGVGSFAVGALSRLGYEVHASTGKAAEEPYLKELGATEVIARGTLAAETPRARQAALDRMRRQCGRRNPRQRAEPDQVLRCRRLVRARRWVEVADDRDAVHPAQRLTPGRRLGQCFLGVAPRGMEGTRAPLQRR